ncbi:MAG TPA: urease accessory protein [Thermoanaerobaculia bacterium]|jgi:ABC-type nickel/cobalt efflux system permease component RcnA|nr:urease accessory protein [Thermoanaerobaculia bacterium]
MTTISLLLVSLLLGLRHALEADHLAAVASLATRSRSLRSTVAQGVAWGLGHTITLLVVGGACLLLRATIPDRVATALEAAVGVMLLALGADVLWRLYRRRIHVHVHRHADGTVHLHAHGHAPEEAAAPHHQQQAHEHPHAHGLPHRALMVGLMHGLAGSAALLLVTLTTLTSAWLGLAYIAFFGAGSILGMAALSAVIALPLRGTARMSQVLGGWYNGLEAAIGVSTILIGAWVLYKAY